MESPLIMCLFLAGAVACLAEEDEDKPEAKIRSPRAGEVMERTFTAKGRTRNIPDGQMVILFRPVGETGFLFPLCEARKGNRSFSETVHHEATDEGAQVIQVRIVPADIARKITDYRRAILKWYTSGRKGPRPGLAPGLLESAKRLAEVEYKLAKE